VTAGDWLGLPLLVAGLGFFAAGTVGLLRLPDLYTRLHALTKADNVGLALVAAGLAVQSGSWPVAARLAVIWLLVNLASAAVAHLIARTALQRGQTPWQG
jgi:multicomponent Na+:H+ antiporter subunit G